MPPSKKSVYQLIDPRDGRPCYTGAASDPFADLKKHLRQRIEETREWIEELEEQGIRPDLRVIALDTADWRVLIESLSSDEERPTIRTSSYHVESVEPAFGGVVAVSDSLTESSPAQGAMWRSPDQDFATHLRWARKSLGVSQSELASEVGKSQSYVARVEGGQQEPSLSSAQSLISALGGIRESRAASAGAYSASAEEIKEAAKKLKSNRGRKDR